MQKSTKSNKNTNKQLRKTDMTTFYKMQKLVTSKKCNTHFVITERKNAIKTHEKKPKPNIYELKMANTNGNIKNLCKGELFAQQHRNKPGQWCQR